MNYIEIAVQLAGLYLVIGLIFGLVFIWRGAARIDPGVEGTSIVFRLLLLPGSVLLWPFLLQRWIKTSR